MKLKSSFILVIAFSFLGCAKKSADTVYTNCKIPKSEGQAISISGFPRYASRTPSTGTVNATVLFVDFPNKPATRTVAQANSLISGATAIFSEQSYGRMNFVMSTPVSSWIRMSKASTDSSYASSRYNLITEAISLADSAVSFASTDVIVVITDPDLTTFGNGPAYTATRGVNGLVLDGKEITNFVTSGYDLNSFGSMWLVHEVTHTLGLVDLYKYGGTWSGAAKDHILYDIGEFSYMGFNSSEANSPGLLAWERWVMSWLDDSQISCLTPQTSGPVTAQLTALHSVGGLKALAIPVNDTQVVVVETRRASGIDINIQKTGTLVYLVNSSVGSGNGAVEVYPNTGITDPMLAQATRSVGESVSVAGIKVEVLASTATEDTVRVSRDGIWIQY